jgi:hypothetical protein
MLIAKRYRTQGEKYKTKEGMKQEREKGKLKSRKKLTEEE